MGLYHSVNVVYGFEIPPHTDVDEIDRALQNQPYDPDGVGYIVVGDRDRLLLVTRSLPVTTNGVLRLAPDALAQPDELATWDAALHDAAARLGLTDHPAPAWLVIHNYR